MNESMNLLDRCDYSPEAPFYQGLLGWELSLLPHVEGGAFRLDRVMEMANHTRNMPAPKAGVPANARTR